MRVKVLFFGQLKEIIGKTGEDVNLQDGISIGGLFDRYASQYPRLMEHSSSLLFSKNREFASRNDALHEGDEIAFLPPVSGGVGGSATSDTGMNSQASGEIAFLTRDRISASSLSERLQCSRDGAVVEFEGIVRGESGGRATLFLEYEAYEPMALNKIREIIHELKQNFMIDGVGIAHRLGRLEIGETSVAIVVTSAHRVPAFEACRHAIDRLKTIVPIWKREHFSDGSVWVEGEKNSSGSSG
ncbi:MAG: hypothetical protein A3F68_10010 [Acidobacteria bacterium RIFCSPLOWO2_12_FULL_54_10]|nr:MAG: hypothetical protein A3F68_10010 [Acidobacteria bacterium RIFCSPLOWO2_12_FULL_54_10]